MRRRSPPQASHSITIDIPSTFKIVFNVSLNDMLARIESGSTYGASHSV
ncbi:MAG: hypothetical protein V7K41_03805 [Nostoc sp.]